jgi:hypothetical protein
MKILHNLILKMINIKTKIIVGLFFFNVISLLIKINRSSYLEIFPCASFILERTAFDNYDILEICHKNMPIFKENIFIFICLFIGFTLFILVLLRFIIRKLNLLYSEKIYRLVIFIGLIFPVKNIKQFIKWYNIVGFMTIYIFNFFNSGIIHEDSLFIWFQNWNNCSE